MNKNSVNDIIDEDNLIQDDNQKHILDESKSSESSFITGN